MKKIKSALMAAFSKPGQPVLPADGSSHPYPAADAQRQNMPGEGTEEAERMTAEAGPARDAEWAWC